MENGFIQFSVDLITPPMQVNGWIQEIENTYYFYIRNNGERTILFNDHRGQKHRLEPGKYAHIHAVTLRNLSGQEGRPISVTGSLKKETWGYSAIVKNTGQFTIIMNDGRGNSRIQIPPNGSENIQAFGCESA